MRRRVIDLSHTISPQMPVYPGTEPPSFEQGTTVAADGFAEKRITFYSHTGTHVDVPAHIFEDGTTIDAMPVDAFVGSALVIDVRGLEEISTAVLTAHSEGLAHVQHVILRTGWSEHWGTERYFEGYPVLTEQAAQWLATTSLTGVGVDAISVDRCDAGRLPIHRILLSHGKVIVENLTELHQLPQSAFSLSILPWKLQGGDGSPVRAVATVDEPEAN